VAADSNNTKLFTYLSPQQQLVERVD